MTSAAAALPASQPRARRRVKLLAGFVLLAVLVGAAAGALAMNAQHAALDSANSDLRNTRTALDAALTRAAVDGVAADGLAPIAAGEKALLAEPSVANLVLFDAGQITHVQNQASRLRQLSHDLAGVERQALDRARLTAWTALQGLGQAIDKALANAVDVGSWLDLETSARNAVVLAATPASALLAVEAVPAQTQALDLAVAKKLAADAAAAKAAADAAAAALQAARIDAGNAVSSLQSMLARAQQTPQYQIGWAVSALTTVTALLPAATTLDAFNAVTQQARGAIGGLRRLFNAHDNAYGDWAQAERNFQVAASQGKNTFNIGSDLQAEKQQLDAAGTAAAFDSIDNAIRNTIAPLTAFDGVSIPLTGKVIVISLAHQTLSAVQDGQVVLTTLVTTGRPQLPTPPGTTSVMSKSHPFLMVSAWPKGSPYYYPPSWVSFVLWFRAGGYGIHDAPWRSNYGPGTNGNNGTHGCVNVPGGVMPRLFNWADIGTPVIVH